MQDVNWSQSILLRRFTEFYQEVALCKQAIAEGRLQRMFEDELPAQPSAHDLAAVVSCRLLRCLQRQGREMAAESSAETLKQYRIAQFVMAVLADEIFILELEWPGREPWLQHLLEQALFKQQQAGQTFYRLLGQLLHGRSRNSQHAELAAVFLLALQLGFKGEYRGRTGAPTLLEYRKRLQALIASYGHQHEADAAPFPQAYDYTLSDPADQRLAPLRPWYRAGVLAFVLYLLLSTGLWFSLLLPATSQLQRLIQQGAGL